MIGEDELHPLRVRVLRLCKAVDRFGGEAPEDLTQDDVAKTSQALAELACGVSEARRYEWLFMMNPFMVFSRWPLRRELRKLARRLEGLREPVQSMERTVAERGA